MNKLLAAKLGLEYRPELDTKVDSSIPEDACWGNDNRTMKGLKHFEHTKQLMSEKRKQWYIDHPDYVHPSKGVSKITIDKDEAQKLYDSGMSYKKLAKHFGCSVNRLQRLQLKTRNKSVSTQMWWNNRKSG